MSGEILDGVHTVKCPVCGAAELIHDTRDLSYAYKGETNRIPSITGDFCPACDEVVLNREYGDRYSELVGLFQRQVNRALTAETLAKSEQEELRRKHGQIET